MGRSIKGRIIILGRGKVFWRGTRFLFGIFFLVWGVLILGVLVNHCRGIGLLGVLGTGARISLRYPRAREPDRLLLAGREENSILGSVWHSFNFSIGPTEIGVSIRKR